MKQKYLILLIILGCISVTAAIYGILSHYSFSDDLPILVASIRDFNVSNPIYSPFFTNGHSDIHSNYYSFIFSALEHTELLNYRISENIFTYNSSKVIFLLYLLGIIFYHPWLALLPLALYLGLGFGSALGFAQRRKKPYLAIFLPPFFLIVHLAYALGLLYGLGTDLERRKQKRKREKIEIRKIKRFGQGWET